MLNRDIEQSAQWKPVASLNLRLANYLFEIVVESATDIGHVIADAAQRGPVGWYIGGEPTADWIDAEGEQPIKFKMDTLHPEDAFVQQIPIECFQVSHIKNDAVTLRNRPLIEPAGADQIEECIASPTGVGQALRKFVGKPVGTCVRSLVAKYDNLFCSNHLLLPLRSRY